MVEKDPIIGKTIGRYVVEELIGKGYYGTYYKAHHVELGDLATVKVIDLNLTENKGAIDTLVRENELISSLPENELSHIARSLDIGVIEGTNTVYDGRSYLLMEYMDQGSLQDNYDAMSLDQRVACITDAIKGLEVAHHYGILHLNIHLGNILIDSNKGVKLSGFGIGTQLDRIEDTHISTDRPSRRRAPEQIMPEPYVRKETDVYQVGAALMFVTTGMEPVEGSIEHMNNAYPDIYPGLKLIIEGCLQWDPKKRPSLAEVRQRLEDLPRTSLKYDTDI